MSLNSLDCIDRLDCIERLDGIECIYYLDCKGYLWYKVRIRWHKRLNIHWIICFTAFHDSDSDEDEQQPIIPEQQDSQLEDSEHAVLSAHDPVSFDMASFLQPIDRSDVSVHGILKAHEVIYQTLTFWT